MEGRRCRPEAGHRACRCPRGSALPAALWPLELPTWPACQFFVSWEGFLGWEAHGICCRSRELDTWWSWVKKSKFEHHPSDLTLNCLWCPWVVTASGGKLFRPFSSPLMFLTAPLSDLPVLSLSPSCPQETPWSFSDSRKPGFSFPHSSYFLSWGQVTRMWTHVMPPCAESCPHVCVAASRPTSLPGAVLPKLLRSPLHLLLRLQHLFSSHLLGALFTVFPAVWRKAQERGQGPRGGVPLGPDGSAPCLPGRWPRAQLGRAGRGQGEPRHRLAGGPGEWRPGVSETWPPLPWALGVSTWPAEVGVRRPWQ